MPTLQEANEFIKEIVNTNINENYKLLDKLWRFLTNKFGDSFIIPTIKIFEEDVISMEWVNGKHHVCLVIENKSIDWFATDGDGSITGGDLSLLSEFNEENLKNFLDEINK